MSEIPKALCKHWIHSREEDTADEEVYRPENYELPPSRWRKSFEIKDNGEFIKYNIGPTDMEYTKASKYTIKQQDTTEIIVEEPSIPSMSIISYDDNILKVKKRMRT
jgi:hypothetical protein